MYWKSAFSLTWGPLPLWTRCASVYKHRASLGRACLKPFLIHCSNFCSIDCFQHHWDGPRFEPLPLLCCVATHHQVCPSVCWQWPPGNNDWLHVTYDLPAVSWASFHKSPKRHHWRVPHGFMQVSSTSLFSLHVICMLSYHPSFIFQTFTSIYASAPAETSCLWCADSQWVCQNATESKWIFKHF